MSVIVPETSAHFGFLAAGYGCADPAVRSLTVVGQGRLAEACRALLVDALGTSVEVGARQEVDPRSDPAGLTVCVADSPAIGLFYDMNEYALTHGAPWHGGYLDGPEVVVGPLFVPGETGCFHDFDVMEEAGRSMKAEHLFLKLNGAGQRPTDVPEFVAALAAGYLTSSVLQHVLGAGSHLEGHFLRVDLGRLQVIRQRAARLARCPACTEGRPDLRSPFL